MKENIDILDKFERYSKSKMPLDEKIDFENELAKDASLRDQLEYSQIVDQMIVGAEALKLKEQMQKDLYAPKTKIGRYLAASLFVLLAGAGLFVFNKKENKSIASNPASVEPKATKQKLNQVEVQKKSNKINPKTDLPQKQQINVQSQLNTSEFKVANVQPIDVQNVTTPALSSAVYTSNVVNKQNNVAAIAKVDPCVGLVGNVEFYTVASCKGEESGELHIKAETVKGGSAPFVFKLGDRTARTQFDQLPVGEYSLVIKDAKGCVVENAQKITVGEKQCKTNKEYVFNPEYDPTWTIPFNKDKEAISVKIVDKSGKMYYQTSVSSHLPSDWNGESNTGAALGMGLYFFTIEYADNSVDEGSIVVSR